MSEKEPPFKDIGDRLTKIRLHLGLKQKELAAQLEISTSSISEIEAGNIKPRFELIFNITRKFNVNIYYLLHGEGTMFVKQGGEAEVLFESVPEYGDWFRQFTWYFLNSPMVRFAIMSYFQTYLVQNADMIGRDIEYSKKKKGENEQ